MSSSACSCWCRTCPWPGLMITSPWELAAPGMVTGDTNHFMVPQSKLNVSTSAGLMCVMVMSGSSSARSANGQFSEGTHLGGEGALGGQPLHRRGAEEAADPGGTGEHVSRIPGLGDRTAVAEHQDVRVDGDRRVPHRLHPLHRLVQAQRGPCADSARGGQAHMRDQYIGAGPGHLPGLPGVEHIR